MKKVIFLIVACAMTNLLLAQTAKKSLNGLNDDEISKIITEKSFTKKDQADIQKILGKDFTALIDSKGHLILTTPTSVRQIKSTPIGEFEPFNESYRMPKLIFWWGKGQGFILKKYLQTKMADVLGAEKSNAIIAILTRE